MQQKLSGNKQPQKSNGFSIIEVLVVSFIIIFVLTAILTLAVLSLRISILVKETNQANFLAQEAIEITRNFRDGTKWNEDGLNTLTTGISHYPLKDNSTTPPNRTFLEGEETIGQFNRQIIFEDVLRDNNHNIVEEGGSIDLDAKKLRIIVSWKEREIMVSTYLTNWQ